MTAEAGAAHRTVAAPALFEGLLDDAALFPPGNAPMRQALEAHRGYRRDVIAPMVGPFVCADERIGELVAELSSSDSPLAVSVVVRRGSSGVQSAVASVLGEPRLRLAALEVAAADGSAVAARLVRDELDAALPPDVDGFVELPVAEPLALDALGGSRYAVKLRTGGTQPAAFPTEPALAAAIAACVDAERPFKCTAGLHNAVRHVDGITGFEHHGFLNVMLAVHVAAAGGAAADVQQTLARRDGVALATELRNLSGDALADVRRRFRSFGTCSVREPIDDLIALGMVPAQ